MKLKRDFFLNNADNVAINLLGKKLVTIVNNKLCSGIIVETESYQGFDDPASHGFSGKTERNYPIFEEGGILYVYFIYGKFHLLNIVTDRKDYPSSVFIRALEPVEGIEVMKKRRNSNNIKNLTDGPAKLTLALGIDKSFNMQPVFDNGKIFIEDINYNNFEIVKTERVGISKGKELLKRFYIKGNKWISKL